MTSIFWRSTAQKKAFSKQRKGHLLEKFSPQKSKKYLKRPEIPFSQKEDQHCGNTTGHVIWHILGDRLIPEQLLWVDRGILHETG